MRTGIDQLMSAEATSVLIVLLYGAALAWALMGRGIRPVLIINAATAAAIALYVFSARGLSLYNSEQLLGVFEIVVFLTSGAALVGIRLPQWPTWTGFAVNFALASALMLFMMTFKMTRLF